MVDQGIPLHSIPIKQYDDVSFRIFADIFDGKYPWAWATRAIITLENATEAYMVKVVAKSQCWKQ
jgi:hypothetical protein